MVPMPLILSQWEDYTRDKMPTAAAAKHTAGPDNANKWLHLSQCHVGAGVSKPAPSTIKTYIICEQGDEVLPSETGQIHPAWAQEQRRAASSPCHANDVACTALPGHMKATTSQCLLFKSFTFSWHSAALGTAAKLRLLTSCFSFIPDKKTPFMSPARY